MKYKLYSRVALRENIPTYKLRKGDVATIVETHEGGTKQEDGYSLEVFNAIGETIAVVTLAESQIEPLAEDAVLHVRKLQKLQRRRANHAVARRIPA
jgi:hypothetical protein